MFLIGDCGPSGYVWVNCLMGQLGLMQLSADGTACGVYRNKPPSAAYLHSRPFPRRAQRMQQLTEISTAETLELLKVLLNW